MLERCRARAVRAGVEVVVHHRRREDLGLPRRSGAVFLAGPTFTLPTGDAAALAAPRGVRAHLAPGGRALVPLPVPEPAPAREIGRVRRTVAGDGAVLGVRVVAHAHDGAAL
jgi:hypothetical protein